MERGEGGRWRGVREGVMRRRLVLLMVWGFYNKMAAVLCVCLLPVQEKVLSLTSSP